MRVGLALLLVAVLCAGARARQDDSDGGLVRWRFPTGPARSTAPSTSYGVLDPIAQLRPAISAYHAKVAAAVDDVRREGRYTFTSLEELALEPRRFDGKPVALLAGYMAAKVSGASRTCTLIDGGAGPFLSATLDGLDLEQRRAMLSADGQPLLFEGTFHVAQDGGGLSASLDVSRFTVFGRKPPFAPADVHSILASGEAISIVPTREKAQELRRRLQAFKQDRRWPYVELGDLLFDPGRFRGRRVAVVGDAYQFSMTGQDKTLRLSVVFAGQDFIQVLLSRLGRGTLLALTRREMGPSVLLIRGVVRRASNGGYYVEAAAAEVLSDQSSLSQALNPKWPGFFPDFRTSRAEIDAKMDVFRGRVRAALDGVRGDKPVVELADLLLEPAAYLGKKVAVLGCPADVQEGADPSFTLSDAPGFSPKVLVKLEAAPAEKRTRLFSVNGALHVAAVEGVVSWGPPLTIYAEDFEDAGPVPFSRSIHPWLILDPKSDADSDRSVAGMIERGQQARRALRALQKDPVYRYVAMEDFLTDPRPYAGTRVSVAGMPGWVDLSGVPLFKIGTAFGMTNQATATMDRMPLARRKDLLHAVALHHLIGVKAGVIQEANGAIYLQGEDFVDLGLGQSVADLK